MLLLNNSDKVCRNYGMVIPQNVQQGLPEFLGRYSSIPGACLVSILTGSHGSSSVPGMSNSCEVVIKGTLDFETQCYGNYTCKESNTSPHPHITAITASQHHRSTNITISPHHRIATTSTHQHITSSPHQRITASPDHHRYPCSGFVVACVSQGISASCVFEVSEHVPFQLLSR